MKIFYLLLFLLPLNSQAQDFLNLLTEEAPTTTLELEGIYLPSSEIEGGSDKSQVEDSSIALSQRVFTDDQNQLTVGARYQKLDLTAESNLLRDYYNHQGNVSFKRQLKGNKFWLASMSYGSASDKPFKNNRDTTLSANYVQRVSDKWFVSGNYSNNRAFLNNIPLPGFFYLKEMSREKVFIIGFPFLFIMKPLSENWTVRYLGIIPWAHRVKLLYTKGEIFKPYVGFEQAPQTYFRHDRESRYDRFFWYERRAAVGFEAGRRKSKLDLSTGYAFDRQFFEARNFSQKKKFLINLENAFFVGLNLRYSFN